MSYKELVKAVAADCGLSQVDTGKCIASLAKVVRETALRGEASPIPNLGVFTVKHRKGRTGINPRTQQPIEIPAKTVLDFRVSPSAREL